MQVLYNASLMNVGLYYEIHTIGWPLAAAEIRLFLDMTLQLINYRRTFYHFIHFVNLPSSLVSKTWVVMVMVTPAGAVLFTSMRKNINLEWCEIYRRCVFIGIVIDCTSFKELPLPCKSHRRTRGCWVALNSKWVVRSRIPCFAKPTFNLHILFRNKNQ